MYGYGYGYGCQPCYNYGYGEVYGYGGYYGGYPYGSCGSNACTDPCRFRRGWW